MTEDRSSTTERRGENDHPTSPSGPGGRPRLGKPCGHASRRDEWESDLWQWLTLPSDHPRFSVLEERVRTCPYCSAAALALARAEAKAGESPGWSLHQIRTRLAALGKATGETCWFRTAVVLVKEGLRRIDLLPSASPNPTSLRSVAESGDPEVTYESHEIGDLRVRLEVERTAEEECRISVLVENRSDGRTAGGAASLLGEDETVYLSFPYRNGEIIFTGVRPGCYDIRIEPDNRPLGRIAVEIREQH